MTKLHNHYHTHHESQNDFVMSRAGVGIRIPLTRREFLQTGVVLLSSAVLPRFLSDLGADGLIQEFTGNRIYIAPDDHTDLFWTADLPTYERAFTEMRDYYLDLTDQTQNEPPEFQSRWNCDGSYWLWVYERDKSQADFNRLIERIRSGHISVPMNALCICPGGTPAEATLRGMYYSGKLERRHKLRFPIAYSMENQTLPYGQEKRAILLSRACAAPGAALFARDRDAPPVAFLDLCAARRFIGSAHLSPEAWPAEKDAFLLQPMILVRIVYMGRNYKKRAVF